MLLATVDPDRRLPEHEQQALNVALNDALEEEDERLEAMNSHQAYPPDGRSLKELQEEARGYGINTMAKTAAVLRRLIAEAKAEKAPAA